MTSDRDIGGVIGSLFFFFIGAGVFAMSFEMSRMAAMFPRTVGAALAILSAIYVVAALRGYRGEAVEATSSASEQAEGLARRLTLLAVMIGWALLFPLVGMFVTSLTACVILMFTGLFERIPAQRLALYLGAVLGMVVSFYLLMSKLLHIPMPRGIFF
ncbi:tripartite tricarboxylate transporter TctB family protein [Nitratireductor sp. CH_MIT9313-5]|jgi:putative tricarboxylic transport membrane protein|uniref:tripartite tricarboxylate transporter TctB family protein n=1 Tax=Nitratireductor sp. CH_MIT9313-5 TaxID=3107764 RepID=UPI00300853DE